MAHKCTTIKCYILKKDCYIAWKCTKFTREEIFYGSLHFCRAKSVSCSPITLSLKI